MVTTRHLIRALNNIPVPVLMLLLIAATLIIFVIPNSYSNVHYESDLESSASWVASEESEPEPVGPKWTYVCIETDANKFCRRKEAIDATSVDTLESCWLTCGTHGSLWPFPKVQKLDNQTVRFNPGLVTLRSISATHPAVERLMKEAFSIILDQLEMYKGLNVRPKYTLPTWPFGRERSPYSINIFLATNSSDTQLTLNTDEAYEIKISEESSTILNVYIEGTTFFGVRHGLETFRQLIGLDSSARYLRVLKNYYAFDAPAFPYRGILIDPARNFIPLDVIKRIVDGMSYNKLNMLHLHLTDSNAFTFHSKRVPQMSQYGTISEDQSFSPRDLVRLVNYARVRGVKIIPELDTPAHAGNGWQFGPKMGMGDLAFYPNTYEPSWSDLCGQPPCGILNPLNDKVYDLLENMYADLLDIFDKDLFHMGGDEVTYTSWEKQPELLKWLNGSKPIALWKLFHQEAFKRLRKSSKDVTAILWSSSLTANERKLAFLNPSEIIIQVWDDVKGQMIDLLEKGFNIIMSPVDYFYLDWGGGTWLGKEQDWKFKNWQVLYDANVDSTKNLSSTGRVLGAEATLWGEKVNQWEVEVKLWPRAAAFAENLWSNPSGRTKETFSRLNFNAYRMNRRGIPTGQLQPASCLHFNGHCYKSGDML